MSDWSVVSVHRYRRRCLGNAASIASTTVEERELVCCHRLWTRDKQLIGIFQRDAGAEADAFAVDNTSSDDAGADQILKRVDADGC